MTYGAAEVNVESELIAVLHGAEVNVAVHDGVGDGEHVPRVGGTAVGTEVGGVGVVVLRHAATVPADSVVTGGLPVLPFGGILEVVAVGHSGWHLRGAEAHGLAAPIGTLAVGAHGCHTV